MSVPSVQVIGDGNRVVRVDLTDRERQVAYRSDITYGQNNEFGFDYLRDNMKFRLQDYVQRELNYAIVDEVDSILIDEARTPLIISGPAEQAADLYLKVNALIPSLKKDVDYTVDEKAHSAILTDSGVERVETRLGIGNLYDPRNLDWLHHVNTALKAHTLYKRDVNYLIEDGKVGAPVGEMNVTGNLATLFQGLVAVGNDPWRYTSTLVPTMVFRDVDFSGV